MIACVSFAHIKIEVNCYVRNLRRQNYYDQGRLYYSNNDNCPFFTGLIPFIFPQTLI